MTDRPPGAIDVEAQRQDLLPAARRTPLLNKVIAAITTGEDFGELAALHAGAVIEQIVIDGPDALREAEPAAIANYPRIVALYAKLLDRLGINPSAAPVAPAIGPPG
jgi:hypothetical protein